MRKYTGIFVLVMVYIFSLTACKEAGLEEEILAEATVEEVPENFVPGSAKGGQRNMMLGNFDDQMTILKHAARNTPFSIQLDFVGYLQNEPEQVIQSFLENDGANMDNWIMLIYVAEENYACVLVDENSEKLKSMNIEFLEEVMTAEYKREEDRLEASVGILVKELYQLGNYEATERIDGVLQRFEGWEIGQPVYEAELGQLGGLEIENYEELWKVLLHVSNYTGYKIHLEMSEQLVKTPEETIQYYLDRYDGLQMNQRIILLYSKEENFAHVLVDEENEVIVGLDKELIENVTRGQYETEEERIETAAAVFVRELYKTLNLEDFRMSEETAELLKKYED